MSKVPRLCVSKMTGSLVEAEFGLKYVIMHHRLLIYLKWTKEITFSSM